MTNEPFQHGDAISPLSFENPFSGGEIASYQGVQRWLLEGIAEGATHTIVWCDTYDHTDYPQHVMPEEDVREIVKKNDNKNMQKLMEVYWLGGDLEEQLAAHRSLTYGPEEQ